MMNWTKEFAVGVDSIDIPHRELFDRINAMLTSMKEGKGNNEVMESLSFLENYVIKHFDEEEAIQRSSNYPKYAIQHAEHEEFKNELKRLQSIFEKEGTSSKLVIQVQQKMSAWWLKHIMELDKDLGKHLLLKI